MDAGVRVLLVDDDPEIAELTATYLEKLSGELHTVTERDPEVALQRLRDEDAFDCIVSDYNMPELDGLDLYEAVRDVDPDVPFILFTGKGSEQIASEAISAGVTDYLQKGTGTEQYEVLANRIENVVGQYRAERRAEATNQQLDRVLDRVSDAFFALNEDWEFEYVNDFAEEFFGPEDELLGTPIQDVAPEEDTPESYRAFREASRTQEPVTFSTSSNIKPETELEARVFPSADGLSVYFRDVTERVRMETKLREANEKITALHDVSADIAACTTADEVYDHAIRAAEDVLNFYVCGFASVQDGVIVPEAVSTGLVTDDLYTELSVDSNNHAAKVYESGDPDIVSDLVEAGYVDPEESDYRSALTIPVGDRAVFQATSEQRDAFSQRDLELMTLFVSHVTEALERIQSEQERQTEHGRFNAVFETSPHPVVETYADGEELVIESVNPAFEDTFGHDQDEVRGDDIDAYVVPNQFEEEADRINAKLMRGEEIRGREVQRVAEDGLRDFILHAVKAEDADARIFVFYVDISEQKRRLRALEGDQQQTQPD